jgi:hypothetical protein
LKVFEHGLSAIALETRLDEFDEQSSDRLIIVAEKMKAI